MPARSDAQQVKTTRHIKGSSLATRLAVTISLTIAAFMIGFGLFLQGFIKDAVRLQVRTAAAEAARMGAVVDYAAWDRWFGTVFQGLTREQIQAEVDRFPTPQVYEREVLKPNEAQLAWNRERLQRAVSADSAILAVEMLTPDLRGLIGTSLGGDTSEFAPVRGQEHVDQLEGGVQEGFLRIDDRRRYVIRGFQPLTDPDGTVRAVLVVYIDARAIDDASERLLTRVLGSAFVFVLVGAAVAVVIGKRVARPVKQLNEDIRAVAAGDLEHHTTPHSNDEIGELARTFDRMTASLREARELERAQARAQRQMAVAGEVTEALFPEQLPAIEGYALAAHHERAGQLSAEYYDVVPMSDGRWALTVASASGSGVPAAMVMAMARSALLATGRHSSDAGTVLRETNRLLARDLSRGMYVSVLLVVLDPRTGGVRVANAGHSPVLRYQAATRAFSLVHSEGIALGFDEGPVFDRTLKVVDVALAPGDRLLLYTPGLAKMPASDGKPLGDKRLAAVAKKLIDQPAGPFVRGVAQMLAKMRGEDAADVDVTLMAIERVV